MSAKSEQARPKHAKAHFLPLLGHVSVNEHPRLRGIGDSRQCPDVSAQQSIVCFCVGLEVLFALVCWTDHTGGGLDAGSQRSGEGQVLLCSRRLRSCLHVWDDG